MSPDIRTDALAAFDAELAREIAKEELESMSAPERLAAYRRGDLTVDQLAHWSRRYPDEVPLLNGEFEWIARTTPEICEAPAARPRSAPDR